MRQETTPSSHRSLGCLSRFMIRRCCRLGSTRLLRKYQDALECSSSSSKIAVLRGPKPWLLSTIISKALHSKRPLLLNSHYADCFRTKQPFKSIHLFRTKKLSKQPMELTPQLSLKCSNTNPIRRVSIDPPPPSFPLKNSHL